MTIIVFGSINMDLVAKASRLPVAGETLLGYDFLTAPGGKGANQAVAVARLGIPTQMVGRVGGDSFGVELVNSLQASGVQTVNVSVDNAVSSGVALISVDDAGENQMIVVPGANGRVNQEDVKRVVNLLPGATALLLQFEIPMNAVLLAAKAAREAGVTVILDPAPAHGDVPDELYTLVDIITPNEVEASQLVGFKIDGREKAFLAAEKLRDRGVKNAIVKLGAQGVVCASAEETFFVPAFLVEAVDTVAAGDAFNGGMAAGLASGLGLREAVVWGAAAGALTTMKSGAQPSLPNWGVFKGFLEERGFGVNSL